MRELKLMPRKENYKIGASKFFSRLLLETNRHGLNSSIFFSTNRNLQLLAYLVREERDRKISASFFLFFFSLTSDRPESIIRQLRRTRTILKAVWIIVRCTLSVVHEMEHYCGWDYYPCLLNIIRSCVSKGWAILPSGVYTVLYCLTHGYTSAPV